MSLSELNISSANPIPPDLAIAFPITELNIMEAKLFLLFVPLQELSGTVLRIALTIWVKNKASISCALSLIFKILELFFFSSILLSVILGILLFIFSILMDIFLLTLLLNQHLMHQPV